MADIEEREKLLRQAILLSDDAKKFLESDLFKAMLARAEDEELSATAALCSVDAADEGRIRDLQSTILRARSFSSWINELIYEGDQAYVMYMDEINAQTE